MNFLYNTFAQATQGIDGLYIAGEDLENKINSLGFKTVAISAVILIVLTIVASLLKDHAPKLKAPLFAMMAFTMAFSFLLLAGSTIYLNVKSDSGGPVHWHADIEYWACGNELELRNPTATLSNKIGTSVLHEHNDQRIHLEGVVVDGIKDASLGKFMHVIDGTITDNAIVVPLNAEGEIFEDNIDSDGETGLHSGDIQDNIVIHGEEKFFRALDGQNCGDTPADVQVFVYSYNEEDKTYAQHKLTRPQDYIIAEDSNVPPGDCIIFEFSETKPFTDKLCEQYDVRDIESCKANGVDSAICEIRDITDYDQLERDFDSSVSITADELDEIEPDPVKLEDIGICGPYFNADGEPTGVEIALTRDDGTLVDPTIDCLDYQAALKTDDSQAGDAL